MTKPKLALYWAASCGGCEIAVLDTELKVLEVADFFDIVFWPCVMDFKYDDIRAMADGEIALTLFNGAIRNSENYEIAKLLRQKSLLMCAFGACAADGGIPGLSNLGERGEMLDYVYERSPSTLNPEHVRPQTVVETPEGTLRLPHLWDTVRTLSQVVPVDYVIPGCPPQPAQIDAVLSTVMDILANGKPLPPRGTVLGAEKRALCEECTRRKDVKKIGSWVRPHEIVADPDVCLLEQGMLCMGPATRAGCGAKCVLAGVPCRGCYGAPANVRDQGAKMAAAIAGVLAPSEPEKIEELVHSIPDMTGTFYRFSLPASTLRRKQAWEAGGNGHAKA